MARPKREPLQLPIKTTLLFNAVLKGRFGSKPEVRMPCRLRRSASLADRK